MGKIIIVVGNSGAGKSTLTRLLCEQGGYAAGLEQIGERPFQSLFAQELKRYALPNQFDYLLFRAEQELAIRQGAMDGILDGGLEQDAAIYTRRFYQLGYLNQAEYDLCERLVKTLRAVLPPPDLVISLSAPLDVIAERYARRGRPLEIARLSDLEALQSLLDDWLAKWPGSIIQVDNAVDDSTYASILPGLLTQVKALIC